MFRHLRFVAVTLVAVMGLAACGGSDEVGGELSIDPAGGDGGALRDPTRTTMTVPPELEDALGTTTTVAGTSDTTAAAQQTTTTEAPDVILIQDDDQGQFFDPFIYQIPVGRPLVWRNVGKVARVIVIDDLGLASPEIAPGSEWSYTFGEKGVFDFRDDTRPYATSGRVQVF